MSPRCAVLPFIACLLAVTAVLTSAPRQANSADVPPEIVLFMDGQRFTPEEVRVRAGTPFMLVVRNQGGDEGEFEIPDLRIEQEIPAGKTRRFKVPALRPGTYAFINDYKQSGAKGRLIAE